MSSQPNILCILTDQQRWDSLGCMGNPWVRTPNLDRLAEEGALFTHCTCNSPICTPSRASLYTGRYPRTTRCRANGQSLPVEEVRFPKLLADAGYRCGLVGKLHTSPCHPSVCPGPEQRDEDGFEVFEWSNSPGPTPNQQGHAYREWLEEKGGERKEEPIIDCSYLDPGRPEEVHATTWCIERGMAFIDESREQSRPWMLNLGIFDPHHSFNPPNAYLQRYLDHLDDIPLPAYEHGELRTKPPLQQVDHEGAYGGTLGFAYEEMSDRDHRLVRAAYWAMIDLIDAQLGCLLQYLEDVGERENTLILFTSDHGEMLGDHGIYLKGPYFYEPLLRVPMIVNGPGVSSDIRNDALIELVDLAPTLLEAAGLDPHPGMQGRSFLPFCRGESPDWRDDQYCEYLDAMPFHQDPAAWTTMVRTQTHKLVVDHAHKGGELYDLIQDPHEHINRWNDPGLQEIKVDLLLRLSHRQAATVDPLPLRQAPW